MSSQEEYWSGAAIAPLQCDELINYVLRNHAAPSTVIICSSQEAFLQDLSSSISPSNADPSSQAQGRSSPRPKHPLLVPTIHQLASSTTVQMAFAPTLPHLRAFLASYTIDKDPIPTQPVFQNPSAKVSMLAIYGLLALHRSTTEHSAQGLSRSLAIIVEAALREKMTVILAEGSSATEAQPSEAIDHAETEVRQNVWMEQIPLLNSSLRLSNDRIWAGKTVSVGSVVSKWSKILVRRDPPNEPEPPVTGLWEQQDEL